MKLTLTSDFIHLKGTPSSDNSIFKDFHNAAFSKVNGWRIPMNIWSMRELAKTHPALLQDPEFVTYGKYLKVEMDNFLHLRRWVKYESEDSTVGNLRPYQWADKEYLKRLPCAGVFNEPRTGKTPTTITLIKELDTKRNIIIAPASLIWNWAKEFEQWYPECEVHVVHGTQHKRKNIYSAYGDVWTEREKIGNRVLIISKDALKSDVSYEGFSKKFDLAVVDEAHFLRNWKSKQSEAVIAVKAGRRYALTGTPTVKHPSDIFGILRFLYPSKYPSYWQFAERYFNLHDSYYGGGKEVGTVKPHRQKELQEMVGLLSVQRKRNEVMKWLPDKQRIDIPVEIEGKQLKMYREMEQYFQTMTETGEEIDAQNVLTQLIRMRQLLLDPRLLGSDTVGAKTKAILEWLDDNREPVVIMSMFTSYLNLLKPEIEKLGLKVGMITGEMQNKAKQESAAYLQEGKTDVLLCNIISAGTGFTLDRASTIIFTDKAWNPSDNQQAEDRITPTTVEKNHSHTIISFEVRQSVDEKINCFLDKKKSLTDIINEGGREAILNLLRG